MKQTTHKKYLRGIRLLIRYLVPYIPRLLGILFLLSVATIGSVVAPLLLKQAIDVEIPQKNVSGVLWLSILLAVGLFISFIARYFQLRVTGYLGQSLLFSLRRDIFHKIQELPLKFFSKQQSGDTIQKITGNVDSVNSLLTEGIMRFFTMLFSLLAQSVIMFSINVPLAAIVSFGGLTIIVFLWFQGRILERELRGAFEREGSMSAVVQESLQGYKVVKAYSQESHFLDEINQKSSTYLSSTYSISMIGSLSEGIMGLVSMATGTVVVGMSLYLYGQNLLTTGTVVLFITYLTGYFRQLSGISELWLMIQRGIVASERIADLLHLKEDVHSEVGAFVPEGKVNGDVEFEDVSFSYGSGAPVLEHISFSVKAGESIAIIGPTGAGKTTFVNLIARLYDIHSGSIRIDGVDVKDWDISQLRRNIGYLIQDTFLFEDTILNNLRYSNDAVTREEGIKMFQFLGAQDFIEQLPQGIDTVIVAGGENISAGQRQVIALARVLLRDPRILILDEATSRIDTKSEKLIQRAIEKANSGRTSFIIAHRLSTIFSADKIILIQHNRIVESGTHQELLAQKGLYAEMYAKFTR